MTTKAKPSKKSIVLTVALFAVGFVLMSFLLELCSGAVNMMLYEAQKTDPVEVAQIEQASMLDGRFSMTVPEGMELGQEERDRTAATANYYHSNASGRIDGFLSVFGYRGDVCTTKFFWIGGFKIERPSSLACELVCEYALSSSVSFTKWMQRIYL